MFDAPDDAFDPDLPDDLRSPSVWTRAREDYQAGESASAVCERYGLTRSVFFKRAKEDGWRKRDAPGAEPNGDLDDMEAAIVADMLRRPATPAYALYRRAWALAEVALHRRRRLEAMSWMRAAKELRKLAMEEMNIGSWRRTALACEEAAALCKARTSPEPDDDLAFEESTQEGSSLSSAPPLRSGGGGAALLQRRDGGGSESDRLQEEPATPSSAEAEEEKRTHRDDPLPMSILCSSKKLHAHFKAEFGWPRDPTDSADQSTRTVESATFILPIEDGEVAAQQTEGPRRSAEAGAATAPSEAAASSALARGPLPASRYSPIADGGGEDRYPAAL